VNARASACWHCGEPLPAGQPIQATVAGRLRPVCCAGCRAAAEWIEQLGLSDYYRLRSTPALRPDGGDAAADARLWARPQLARHVLRKLPDGGSETLLAIEGLRCAGCSWLIEHALLALPGVRLVQVNAGSRRARIVWDDARTCLAELVDCLQRAGYRAVPLDARALDDSRRRESRQAMKQLLVAGFGAMQAMMYASALYLGAAEHMDTVTRDLFRWLGLLVATPVVLYSARPFFDGAARSLRARRLGMDVPVSLAILLIYTGSMVEVARGGAEVYFESVSMFVFFLLTGRYLEMRARHRAGDLSDALARLTPAFADRLRPDGSNERVGALELAVGDRVQIAEGGLVPADGRLDSAYCRVDESLLSGESAPQPRRRGDTLLAGSLLVEGPARLQVQRVGEGTVLAGIGTLIARAQSQRPRLARAGEQAAARFVARVLTLAALTAVGWCWLDPARAFAATVAVLVVSCPCAFALAVPAAITRALAVLARREVLVVQPDAIETLTRVTHVVFDKTGTLTDPQMSLDDVRVCGRIEATQALELAAALAQQSRHPIARAIAAAAAAPRVPAQEVRECAGAGLCGTIDGRRLRLGRADYALDGARVDADLREALVLADDTGPLATFHPGERLRRGAREAIAALREQGLQVEILSGDAPHKVRAAAQALGIDTWQARCLPGDKLARLEQLRTRGACVMAVGDGINDAPVLAGADISVALAGGAELAQASSGLVLAGERLDRLASARCVARRTLAIVRQNQRWALAYNLSTVPLAALGLVPPWLAALGMSLSSLLVVLNALRIGRSRRADHGGAQRGCEWPQVAA
jgi:Cu2+-exporting ATPase